MKNNILYFFFIASFFIIHQSILSENLFTIKGVITEIGTNKPIAYANVFMPSVLKGTQTNEKGDYAITDVSPGFYQLRVSCIGYQTYQSFQFRITTKNFTLNIELEKNTINLDEVLVQADKIRKNANAPLSLQIISLKEIEKTPGANRDISKVISSYAGVATPALLYRNDILVRGGGPSENKFYLDGIEIPNINHFATQGASGGPVGILNADLLREVDFYSGGFPVIRETGISSVLDFKLKDGAFDNRSYKFTLGASEAGVSSNGPINKKTTYQLSVRYSYLQLLFSVLKLPFLPRYLDGQFKIKTRFDEINELTILGIGAIDDMKLNNDVDPSDEDRYQIYLTLPEYKQKTYTLGAVYKRYLGNRVQSLFLSNSLLRNKALKYTDNDSSNPDLLRLRYRSDEGQTRLRFEESVRTNRFRIIMGTSVEYATYTNNTYNKNVQNGIPILTEYHSFFDLWKYGIFSSLSYLSKDKKLSASGGLRIDGNSYSSKMSNPFKQFAPRMALSYQIKESFYLNFNIGRYFQLPLFTSMGFKNNEGVFSNWPNIRYFGSNQLSGGLEYKPSDNLKINLDGFYKRYFHGLLSIQDSIPIASLGSDYGVIGDEAVNSSSKGKAYGLELAGKWYSSDKLSLLASYTFVRSFILDIRQNKYLPSSWDNRHLFTGSVLYSFKKNWDLGVKFRVLGGAPYTPVDTEKSALVESWNTINEAVLNYDKFNSLRLKAFSQFDIRLDKTFYWANVMFGVYIDIQNLFNQKYLGPPDYISTGVIENPDAPISEQKYIMKWLKNESGTILPTLGVTIEF